jgi:hypothetical protein
MSPMNLAFWNYLPAAMLIVMGALFAWIERRAAIGRELLSPSLREFATDRSRRRVRIAALLIFVGVLMVCGNATDPRDHPLRYLVIWGLVALMAVSMLCYGVYDFYATRVLWVEKMRLNAKSLGEAARRARTTAPSENDAEDRGGGN